MSSLKIFYPNIDHEVYRPYEKQLKSCGEKKISPKEINRFFKRNHLPDDPAFYWSFMADSLVKTTTLETSPLLRLSYHVINHNNPSHDELDGFLQGRMGAILLHFLKQLSATKKNYQQLNKLNLFIEMLEFATKVNLLTYKFFDPKLRSFAITLYSRVCNKVLEMKKVESPLLLLMGNLTHAIVLKVSVGRQNKRDITVYNTGLGISDYHKSTKNGKAKPLIFKDISTNKLNLKFWKTLFKFLNLKNIDALYEFLYKECGSVTTYGKPYQIQQSGNCTWQSLIVTLHDFFNPKKNKPCKEEGNYLEIKHFITDELIKSLQKFSVYSTETVVSDILTNMLLKNAHIAKKLAAYS